MAEPAFSYIYKTVDFLNPYDINTFKKMTHILQLPFLPVSLATLAESKFFLSKDSRVVRAGFWMLEAAWKSPQPGSIPSGFEALSYITRLPEEDVATHYEVLTAGWCLQEDGRLHHLQLEEIAESIEERFGPELAVLAESAMVACQGGAGEFELVPSDQVTKKRRGKTAFPKDFSLERATLEAVIEEGYYSPELQSWLIQEVRNYALADDKRQSNWQATVRKFMGSSITRQNFKNKFGFALGMRPSVDLVAEPGVTLTPRQRLARASTTGAAGGRATFAQMGAERNSSMMSEALTGRFPQSSFADKAQGEFSQPAPGMTQ